MRETGKPWFLTTRGFECPEEDCGKAALRMWPTPGPFKAYDIGKGRLRSVAAPPKNAIYTALFFVECMDGHMSTAEFKLSEFKEVVK